MRILSKDPCAPRKMRPNDERLTYDDAQRTIPARAPPLPSTPASRTARIIAQYLESGPKPQRELMHRVLVAGAEPDSFDDALQLLGAVEWPQMQLPAIGLVVMIALLGQFVAKMARADVPVEPRGQRRPRHLGDRRI